MPQRLATHEARHAHQRTPVARAAFPRMTNPRRTVPHPVSARENAETA